MASSLSSPALLRWLLLRRWRRERARVLLTVLGVALGVSVFVAVRLASGSAMASFADTVDAVTGRANLQISAVADGFDERLYSRIRREPGVRAAAPVVEVNTLARAGAPPRANAGTAVEMGGRAGYDETLMVLGLDPFVERPFARLAEDPDSLDDASALALLVRPRTIAITRTLAARHGLRVGDTLTVLASGVPVPLTVAGLLGSEALQQAMGGNVVIADIATAQEVFARRGRLDRVDLIVAARERDHVAAALAAWLPSDARPERPQARTRQVENLVRAFSLNLLALSFIAIFVSTFLIFNAIALAVVRQRRDIGVLRALGLTRRQVVTLFLLEGLLLGGSGGLAGAALGALAANLALHQVGRTLTVLYLVGQASRLWLDPGTLLAGLLIGVFSALASALAPALEAADTPPGATLREGSRIEAGRMRYGRLGAAGALAVLAAGGTAAWTIAARRPLGGFVSAFLLLAGFSLLAPLWTLAAERLASPVARRFGIAATLGARAVRETAARASVVIAAVMVAVGMLVALTIMVGSFRGTVDTWITQSLRGDLYVEPVGHRASQRATSLPPELVGGARRLPGVAAVDTYRASSCVLDGLLANIVGIEFAVQRRYGRLQFVGGEAARAVLGRALAGDGVVVTESFAHRHRVRTGDRLVLPTPAGPVRVKVEGVFYDYSGDAGAVLMDRALYARLWRDDRTESLALYLQPGVASDSVRLAFVRLAGPGRLLHVTPNQALRKRVLLVFDQTFQITWALQTIAAAVSVLGVISTLTTLVLQRRRELAVLRAAGALRSQVRTLVLVESGVLGAAGSLLGCVAGFGLALLLVHVINREFFGWSIRMSVDPWVFVRAVVFMTLTATLAGLAPARLAAGRATASALRVE
jgi:putative ABC transport system permease protein